MILYHYTSKVAYDQIMQSRKLLPTDPWTTMDKAYGQGWYFTDRPPDKCDAWTVAYCWRNITVFEKVEYYLKFDIPDEILKHCRDHVYMLTKWDDRINYIEGSKNQECSKGSCIDCDIIPKVKEFFKFI